MQANVTIVIINDMIIMVSTWPFQQIGRVKVMVAGSTRKTRTVEHVVSSWDLINFCCKHILAPSGYIQLP